MAFAITSNVQIRVIPIIPTGVDLRYFDRQKADWGVLFSHCGRWHSGKECDRECGETHAARPQDVEVLS